MHCFQPLGQCKNTRSQALQTTGDAKSEQAAKHQRQVEASHVNQQPFEDVDVPTKMGPPHAAGVIAVREAPLDQLAAFPHQPFATNAANTAAVGVYRITLGALTDPIPTATVRLGNVRAAARVMTLGEHLVL